MLVLEHFGAETGMKTSARYDYFKPENVKNKPQFLGPTPIFTTKL
jgi:hypothetical protein